MEARIVCTVAIAFLLAPTLSVPLTKDNLHLKEFYPSNLTAFTNETVTLRCRYGSNGEPVYRWYKTSSFPRNGSELTTENVIQKTSSQGFLVLPYVSALDQGWYTCEAIGDSGTTLFSTHLTVWPDMYDEEVQGDKMSETSPGYTSPNKPEEAPTFRGHLVPHMVKPSGNLARMKCSADGNPVPYITWYKNGETSMTRTQGSVRFSRWQILLEDLVVSDSGNYTCIVCNVKGCINFTYTLEVIERVPHKPILMTSPMNRTVEVGGDANFTCKFLSDTQTYTKWTKKNNLPSSNYKNNKVLGCYAFFTRSRKMLSLE